MSPTARPVPKSGVGSLAAFGGERLFATPRSTSNLVRPDFEAFLAYSRIFHEQRHYTNNGPLVRMLEGRLAAFHDAAHCVAFCSGFWALVLAMKALALPGRTEVVMPSLTYRRMADVAAWAGLKPRFCEVEASTLAQSAASVEPCLGEDTALVVGVHPIVGCCDVEGLEHLARSRGIPLLFDSVESAYEAVPAGRVGRFGDAEVFSLHASKLLNGFEGGYATTGDAALARKLALARGFGFEGESNVTVAGGTNAKLNEVHAALALASLDGIEAQVGRNRERHELYRALLPGVPGLRLVEFPAGERSGCKNVVVELLDDWPLSRDATLRILNAENVLARAYYSPALHAKPMDYPHVPASLPLTDLLAERYMLLPCGHFVSGDDIREVVALLSFLHEQAGAIAGRAPGGAKDGAR